MSLLPARRDDRAFQIQRARPTAPWLSNEDAAVLVEILNVRPVAECLVLDGASLSATALQQVGAIGSSEHSVCTWRITSPTAAAVSWPSTSTTRATSPIRCASRAASRRDQIGR